MQHLTTGRYDAAWTGTAKQFVLNWTQQVRNYQELAVQPGSRISDEMLLTLLQNAVQGSPDLRQVKTSMQYDQAKTGEQITYVKYVALLTEAATMLDDANGKSTERSRRNRHRINMMESAGAEGTPADTPASVIDMLPEELYDYGEQTSTGWVVNQAMQGGDPNNKGGDRREVISMPRKFWDQLTPEQQEQYKDHNDRVLQRGKYRKRVVKFHEQGTSDRDGEWIVPSTDDDPHTQSQRVSADGILAFASTLQPTTKDPADIRSALSVNKSRQSKAVSTQDGGNDDDGEVITVNGQRFKRIINKLEYVVSKATRSSVSSLVDRGANGGLAGADCKVLATLDQSVDISGIDNHEVTDLAIVNAAAVVKALAHGEIVVIMNRYAYLGQGKTIHSSGQIEHYKNTVDDRSRAVGGKQLIVTLENYVIPLVMKNGPHL